MVSQKTRYLCFQLYSDSTLDLSHKFTVPLICKYTSHEVPSIHWIATYVFDSVIHLLSNGVLN